MKKLFWFIAVLFVTTIQAQIKNVVHWNYQLQRINDNEYNAILYATIDDGWHLYSKDTPEDTGIIPTVIKVSSSDATNVGAFKEIGKKVSEFSEVFGGKIVYYSNKAQLVQRIKLKDPAKGAKVNMEVTFQTCNDRICLAPSTLEFEKSIAGLTPVVADNTAQSPNEKVAVDTKETAQATTVPNEPATVVAALPTPIVNGVKVSTLDYRHPLMDAGAATAVATDNNNTLVFILGFLGGLLALLTPCVFPMIPLTVSYFTKGAENKAKGKRNAIVYGIFILLIFVALSIPFYIVDGISGNIFNNISTNIWLNLVFFAVFLAFAFSFFGYFDIVLPSWVVNKSSKAEETGGFVGIFFMALTLVIVSFSCTGPILGSLLGGVASSAKNVPVLLTFALAGFGLAWAVVFGLLALFPQALQALPKSGGWMNTLKVVLGFIEIGLALKFLSKADLVSKTFLLKREIFIALWILTTLGLILYLFGVIRFPHDDKKPKISLGRKLVGVLGIVFVIYLIPGLFPSKTPRLAMLGGILPPVNVSIYPQLEEKGVLGLDPQNDYFKAVQIAKRENKPVLIDFTGFGCENCRRMEETVWSQPDVLQLLKDDVVLASVYVDDKQELPKDQQISIDLGNGIKQKIKTIGDKWSMFQQVNFNNNSQPHYVLVTPDQRVINAPISGYMSKEKFKDFLEQGIGYYKKHEEALAAK